MTQHWHLHVTVEPHENWGHADVAEALRRDVERHGVRPLVITNWLCRGERSYRELIPTKHHEGDEASASREIFHLGVMLNNAGWRVRRLKIEGEPTPDNARRAIYFETHLRDAPLPKTAAPYSTSLKHGYHTIRRSTYEAVRDCAMDLMITAGRMSLPLEIEAVVMDTAPEMDDEWINQ